MHYFHHSQGVHCKLCWHAQRMTQFMSLLPASFTSGTAGHQSQDGTWGDLPGACASRMLSLGLMEGEDSVFRNCGIEVENV